MVDDERLRIVRPPLYEIVMKTSEMNDLGDRIAEHAAHLDAATHRLLTDLRTFDESGAWAKQGLRSCSSWLSWRVGWDVRTANEHVRVAIRLGKLPKIDDALRRGEMSFAKVRAMVRVATPQNEEMLLEEARYSTGAQLEKICRQYASVRRHDHDTTVNDDQQRRYITRRDTADGMVRVEAVLHPEEAALVWAAIERIAVGRCREREDARRDEAREEPSREGGREEARCEDTIGFAEPAESHPNACEGAGAEARCEAKIGSAEPTQLKEFERIARTVRMYPTRFDRADALLLMAEQVLRGTSPDRSPIDLVLTASVDALTRKIEVPCSGHRPGVVAVAHIVAGESVSGAPLSNDSKETPSTIGTYVQGRVVDPAPFGFIYPSEIFDEVAFDPDLVGVLGDGTCISPTAARRLACDCGLTAVLESDHGTPITIGRKRRTIPASMKRSLLRRDRTCRFPGCCVRVFLQGHHRQHWMDGGPTELDNLVSLCGFHHRYVHEYGFRVELACDGAVQFIDARGKVLKNVPERIAQPDLGWPAILAGNEPLGITAETCACGWNGGPVSYHLCIDALIAADEGRIRYPI